MRHNQMRIGRLGHSLGADRKSVPQSVLFMDSNREHLEVSLLWENLTLVPCGNIPELTERLPQYDLNTFDVIIVHVGVNDIDRHDGSRVAEKLSDMTRKMADAAPGVS